MVSGTPSSRTLNARFSNHRVEFTTLLRDSIREFDKGEKEERMDATRARRTRHATATKAFSNNHDLYMAYFVLHAHDKASPPSAVSKDSMTIQSQPKIEASLL